MRQYSKLSLEQKTDKEILGIFMSEGYEKTEKQAKKWYNREEMITLLCGGSINLEIRYFPDDIIEQPSGDKYKVTERGWVKIEGEE